MNPYQENLKKLHKESKRSRWEKTFEFQLKYHEIPPHISQFKFHETRKWAVDFAWPNHRIIVEIEGGIWIKGGAGHSHPISIERDIEKYNQVSLYGYRLFRFTDKEIRSGAAINLLKEVFKQEELNHALQKATNVVDPVIRNFPIVRTASG